jgi:hypothetical protein
VSQPREAHNAPLHLFSASPELAGFGRSVYRQRSATTSLLLRQLLEESQGEGFAMSYTMGDFKRDMVKKDLEKLSPEDRRDVLQSLRPKERREVLQSLRLKERREVLQSLPLEERREVLQSLPLEERLAGLSAEQIREYLDQLTAGRPAESRKPRRKR